MVAAVSTRSMRSSEVRYLIVGEASSPAFFAEARDNDFHEHFIASFIMPWDIPERGPERRPWERPWDILRLPFPC